MFEPAVPMFACGQVLFVLSIPGKRLSQVTGFVVDDSWFVQPPRRYFWESPPIIMGLSVWETLSVSQNSRKRSFPLAVPSQPLSFVVFGKVDFHLQPCKGINGKTYSTVLSTLTASSTEELSFFSVHASDARGVSQKGAANTATRVGCQPF